MEVTVAHLKVTIGHYTMGCSTMTLRKTLKTFTKKMKMFDWLFHVTLLWCTPLGGVLVYTAAAIPSAVCSLAYIQTNVKSRNLNF